MGTSWASTNRNGDVETFTDLRGRPTTDRPHVHTIFHGGSTDHVTLIATTSRGDHPWRTELRDTDGNVVRDAQRELARQLEDRERRDRDERSRDRDDRRRDR